MLVAHLSLRKWLPALGFLMLLYLVASGLVVASYLKAGTLKPLAFFVLALGGGIAVVLISTATQVVLHQGRALWIESGKLIYLNRFFIVIECASIRGFSEGRMGTFQRPQILVTMEDGSRKAIPIEGLKEPSEIILEKLNTAILGKKASAPG